MHELWDSGPRTARHVASCVDGEDTATAGPIDDGIQRTLCPCEVECRGTGDNCLLRRGFEEDTKCAGAVGDVWGREHLPRECGGPERGELLHFI